MKYLKHCAWALMALLIACKGNTPTTGDNGAVPAADSVKDTFVSAPISSDTQTDSHQKDDSRPNWMEIPAPMKNTPEQILRREGYTVSYNKDTKIANWVAWRLTKNHLHGYYGREEQVFREDMDVPAPRADDWDYYDSRYDRGHLCPSADNKWSEKAQTESFLFTNVAPQNHGLNKDDWNDLEMQCRDWARKYGEVFIVAGPIFYNGVTNTIGKHRVAVPDAFFKVVLCRKGEAKAIGFVYPNRGGKKPMTEYVKSVDEIERLTGIDFFPKLDNDTENDVEGRAKSDLCNDWSVVRYYDSPYKR